MPVTRPKSRLHDPRAALVLEVLEEVLRFSADESLIEQHCFVRRERGDVAGGITDDFMWRRLLESVSFEKWSPAAVRAVVEVIVANAPDGSLRELAAAARRERRDLRAQLRDYNVNAAKVYGEDVAKKFRDAGGRARFVEDLHSRKRGA